MVADPGRQKKNWGARWWKGAPGGKSGGMARVSSAGHRLMERYERLERGDYRICGKEIQRDI